MAKSGDQRLAYEAEIQANAASFTVHLFLGTGRFERAEAASRAEILAIGRAMSEAYPACQARPIYYAVDASGRSTTITQAQLGDDTMIRAAEAATQSDAEFDRKAKKAAAMRVSRAAKKKEGLEIAAAEARAYAEIDPALGKLADKIDVRIKALDEAADRHIDMVAATEAQTTEAAQADSATGFEVTPVSFGSAEVQPDPFLAAVYADSAKAKAEIALAEMTEASRLAMPSPAPRILPDLTPPPAKPVNGLCMSKPQALAEALLTYGADAKPDVDFTLKKTGRGQWFWGPLEIVSNEEIAMKKPTAKTAAAKPAKSAPVARPSVSRAEIQEKAERGILPPAPDFSAATHTRFRTKLAEVVALVKAGDIKGLKAVEIKPVSSSRKAIEKYRGLALIALKAKAAK